MNNEDIRMLCLLGIAGIVAFAFLGTRTQNRLAPLRERVNEAHTNVKAIVEKRNRLIKQLLEIAAAYASHERGLHERISADFGTPQQIALNPNGALAYVSRLVNTFPDLRADRTYLDLSSKVYALESELEGKHQSHSATVRDYNSVRLSFPHDLFAWWGDFEVARYLDGTDVVVPLTEEKGKDA